MADWFTPRRIAAAALAAAFFLVSVELGLRARITLNTHIEFEEGRLFRYPPHTQVGPTPAYRTNNAGFFGPDLASPKPANTYRVIIMGSSPVAEPELPAAVAEALHERMPGHALEVATAGLPRYTSYQTALLFERAVVPLDPDCVVVYLGLNDNVYNTFPRSGEQPYDGYYDPGDFTRSVLADMVWYQAYTKRFDVIRTFESMPSAAYFEAHLRVLLRTADRHGIRIILAPIACAWPTQDETLAATIRAQEGPMSHFWGTRDAALEGVATHQRITEALAAEYSTPLCDVSGALPRTAAVYRDFCHFTSGGIRAFGAALAACIAEHAGAKLDSAPAKH